MNAACPTSDIAFLTVSWINEQLRLEATRRELVDAWDPPTLLSWRRQALMVLAGCLCGIGLLLVKLYA
jgi:hypothetical protein